MRPTPSSTPTPAPSLSGPAAYCNVDDVPTPTIAYADHARTFLDWTYALPETYIPPDLVNIANGGPFAIPRAIEAVGAAEVLARRGDPSYSTLLSDAPNSGIRGLAYADFVALRAAARQAGTPLVVLSAYRSYALQVKTFEYWVSVGGYQQALRTSARPGHSEHQLGTAIDFGDGTAAPWEYADWGTTPTGAWLAAHAAEFGFVMTFPKGKTNVTCYDYEPWHYRWVGKALAQTIAESRVTLREYQSAALR
jgi:D-alanyl-D-alanine carboxypeptidase